MKSILIYYSSLTKGRRITALVSVYIVVYGNKGDSEGSFSGFFIVQFREFKYITPAHIESFLVP